MNIWQNKPLLIGGGLCIVVVVMMASGSKAGATTGAIAVQQSGPSDAQIAAGRDIQVASLQAAAASASLQANLTIAQLNSATDLQKAGMDAQLQKYALDSQLAISSLQLKTQADMQSYQIASDERRELGYQTLQASVAKYTLDSAYNTTVANNAFQLSYAENANQSAERVAAMQAQLVNNQLAVSRDLSLAQMSAGLSMAAISADTTNRQVAALRDTQIAQFEYSARDNESARNFAVNLATVNANQNMQLAATAANERVTSAGIAADQAKWEAYYDTRQVEVSADAQKWSDYYAADSSIKIAQINGSVAKKQSTNKMIGGIVGTVGKVLGGLF